MAESSPTIGELVKTKAISLGDLDAAIEALLNGRLRTSSRFSAGWNLDLVEAVYGQADIKRPLESPTAADHPAERRGAAGMKVIDYRARAAAMVKQAEKLIREAAAMAREGKHAEGRRLLSDAQRLMKGAAEIYKRLAM